MENTDSINNKTSNISDKVANLRTIMEIRGKLLNEFYKDMKTTAERVKTNEPNANTKTAVPLKEFKLVRPNKVELVTVEQPKSLQTQINHQASAPTTLNSTFTIAVNNKSPVKNTNEKKVIKNFNKTIQPIVKPLQLQNNNSSKIPRFKSNYSPLKQDKNSKIVKVDLNELRERVIRRKFGYLWLRKVYGRVLPSVSDKYYKLSFIREYFNTWKNLWWHTRKEWRLNVKAECFYNYNLYKNIWTQWAQFVIESKKQNKKLQIAINHRLYYLAIYMLQIHNLIKKFLDANKEKLFYFKIWKSFSKGYKVRKLSLERASERNNQVIMKIYYIKWQASLKSNLKETKFDELAVRHYNYMQLTRVYTIWKHKYLNEINERRKLRLAISHSRQTLLMKCFHSLIIYTKYRQKKDVQKAKVDEYYESQLVYRLFQKWKQKYDEKMIEKEKNLQIESIQKRILIIYYYENWKHAYHYKQYLAYKEQQSCKFYEKKLKSKVFKIIFENYKIESVKKQNDFKAQIFNNFWIQKRSFEAWRDKFEEKEDIKLMHLYYKAKKFRENFLIQKFYQKWYQRLNNYIEFNNEFSKVDKFYNQKLYEKYFNALKTYVHLTRYKRTNYEKAIKQHQFNVFYSVFSKWYEKYEESIEDRMNMRIAILHNESRLQMHVFSYWRSKAELKIHHDVKMHQMSVYYNKTLKMKYFKNWKDFVNGIKLEESNEVKAERFHFKSICSKPFKHWKVYLNESRKLNEKVHKAETFYNSKLSRTVFVNWRSYAKEFHLKVVQANRNYDVKMMDLKLNYFQEWREFTKLSKEERFQEKISDTLYLRNLLLKVFRGWNSYTTNRAVKKFHDQNLINEFKENIQQKLVFNIYFQKWKLKKDKKILDNYSTDLAKNHYNKNLSRKLLDHWKVYTKIAKRKKLLEKQADWFNEMRLKFYAYKLWQQKYLQILEENQQNNKAIIHWAWQLEKKCFLNWLLYINNRKQKKQRYNEAINDRHNEIIKSSIKCLIIYSNDSRERRFKQLVNQKQHQITFENQIEFKYFNRWKEIYKKNKQKRAKLSNLFNKVDDFERRINSSSYLPISTSSVIVPTNPLPLVPSGKQTPILSFTDLPAMRVTNRPQPRKPAFLLDSLNKEANTDTTTAKDMFNKIDSNKSNSSINMITTKKTSNDETDSIKSTASKIESKSIAGTPKPEEQLHSPVGQINNNIIKSPASKHGENKLVLLPPSAFTVLSETKIVNNDNLNSINNTINHSLNQAASVRTQSRSSSVTTTFDTEIHQELTLLKLNNETSIKKNEENYNLIKLKERLENLSIKKDKLKNLKEQELLLEKYTNSADTKNISLSETLYQELSQIRNEINDLQIFIKHEKKELSVLLKQYKLA